MTTPVNMMLHQVVHKSDSTSTMVDGWDWILVCIGIGITLFLIIDTLKK